MSRLLVGLAGLLALAAVAVLCVRSVGPDIQTDIASRTETALVNAGFTWASPTVDGRDVALVGVAPDAQARVRAGDVAREVYGARTVQNRLSLASESARSQQD